MSARLGAVALAALVTTAVGAHAVVPCRSRMGAVVVRDVCRKHETTLDRAALGALGAQGTAGTPGAQVRIADANGKLVGAFDQFTDSGLVATVALGTDVVPLPVDRAGFVQGPSVQRAFLTSDCTGDRYVLAGPLAPPITFATIAADGFTVSYGRQVDAAPHAAYYGSSRVAGADANAAMAACQAGMPAGVVTSAASICAAPLEALVCVDCCRQLTDVGQFIPASATPVRTFDLRTLALTPPFHLERR